MRGTPPDSEPSAPLPRNRLSVYANHDRSATGRRGADPHTLIFAAGAFAQTSGATVTRTSSFPAAGLATSETAQVNVTNLASNPAGGTAASCAGSISFVNAAGTAIGSAAPFTATSGQTFSAKLPFANSLGSGPRVMIRAVVSLTFSSANNAPCSLDTSFETFDSTTGVTHIYLTGSAFEALPAARGR